MQIDPGCRSPSACVGSGASCCSGRHFSTSTGKALRLVPVPLLQGNSHSNPLPIKKVRLFVFLSLSCKISLYIWILDLSEIQFANIFFHFVFLNISRSFICIAKNWKLKCLSTGEWGNDDISI
uniref:Uncharacterized protein n=1 Tax=Molossus molossus TaxID=27622 RepID=A0A7J8BJZ3_MOLMO|nr:hypothetical protein HJG59_010223 [Molossus molossus]